MFTRFTFARLESLVLSDYRTNGYKSLDRVQLCFAHLRGHFARMRPAAIGSREVSKYIAARLDTGASRGSVNRELNTLRRGMRLAQDDGYMKSVPRIQRLREAPPRQGFITSEQLAQIIPRLPQYLRGFVRVLFITAWRKSEVSSLRWEQICGEWVYLDPDASKNGEGRRFPIISELRRVLETQGVVRKGPWVFHRNGRKVGDFRKSWYRATKGIHPRPLVHGLRRSGARSMVQAGIPTPTVLALAGWKSERMLKRYCIVDHGMLSDAGAKLEAFLKQS